MVPVRTSVLLPSFLRPTAPAPVPVELARVLETVNVPPAAAKKLLKDGDVIDIDGLRLHVIHTPGHTPGGISIKCGDMLFSGDTLFFEGVGRTDLPGGSYKALINSIKTKLFTLPDATKVFPGHGPETTIGHEKRNNPFV